MEAALFFKKRTELSAPFFLVRSTGIALLQGAPAHSTLCCAVCFHAFNSKAPTRKPFAPANASPSIPVEIT